MMYIPSKLILPEFLIDKIKDKVKKKNDGYYSPILLLQDVLSFIDSDLKTINEKLYEEYLHNRRGLSEKTLRTDLSRSGGIDDGATQKKRNLLCLYAYGKGYMWNEILENYGFTELEIAKKTLSLKRVSKKSKRNKKNYGSDFSQTSESISTNPSDSLSKYKAFLAEKYKSLQMGIIEVSIPIENIVRPKLKKKHEHLNQIIKELEIQRRELLTTINTQERYDKLSKQIRELKEEVERVYDIGELLNSENDVFIQAPAGYGKTTLMHLLVYELAKDKFEAFEQRTPILVELKYYQNSLIDLVKDNLNNFSFEDVLESSNKVILLIDGLDELNRNSSVVLNEIKKIKAQFNKRLKIVFSGRLKPKFKNKNLIFDIYNIEKLDVSLIKEIINRQLTAIDYNFNLDIERLAENEVLRTPLYLMLFISYLKWNSQYEYKTESIEAILINKAVFINTILVDRFIKYYEGERSSEDIISWEHSKILQMELVAYAGFFLTFELNNRNICNRIEIENAIKIYVEDNLRYNEIITSEVVDSFLFHNILQKFQSSIGFENTELRLFFTALHLVKKIDSKQKFEEYSNSFKKDINSDQDWSIIEEFIFGLIEPNNLLNEELTVVFDINCVLTDEIWEEFILCLKFISARQSIPTGILTNKLDVLNAMSGLLATVDSLSSNELYMSSLIQALRNNEIGISYQDILQLITKSKSNFLKSILAFATFFHWEYGKFHFPTENVMNSLFKYLYSKNKSDNYDIELYVHFLDDYFFKYNFKFLDYFTTRFPSPQLFQVVKIMNMYLLGASDYRINASKTNDRVKKFLKSIFTQGIFIAKKPRHWSFLKDFLARIINKSDGFIVEDLLALIKKENVDNQIKANTLFILTVHFEAKDSEALLQYTFSKERRLFINAVKALLYMVYRKNLFDSNENEEKINDSTKTKILNRIVEKLHSKTTDSETKSEIKKICKKYSIVISDKLENI